MGDRMSDTVNTAEIKVVVNGEGVSTGLQKIEESAGKTARTIDNLGSGPGLKPLAEGATTAAGQVDKSTKNMADAIQRATAAMNSGAKGSAEYYAALANSRGLKMDVLKPYLDQLDQATKKAAMAAEAQKKLEESTRFLDGLRSQADSIGKTGSQLLELRAAQLGVSDAARPMIEQLRAAEEAAGGTESRFGKLKVALAAVAGVAAAGGAWFASMMKGAIDAADELGDLSKSTGVAVADLAGLKLAAEQSGGDLNGIADAINKLSMNIGKDAEKFQELGITAKDPVEAFKQLADVFASIEDPQTRAALGAAALGKSWASAAPLLAEGGNAIAEMVEKGKQLSGMTEEMVAQSDAFNDKMAELSATIDGFKVKVASDMLPALNNAVGAIQTAHQESGKLHALWVALGAVGAFLFTDEFASAQIKLKNLKKELDEVRADLELATNTPAIGFVGRWLFGEDKAALEARVAEIKRQIKEIQDAANPPTPFQDAFGDQFMARIAAYRANQFIGGDKPDDEAKKRAAAIEAEKTAYAGLITTIRERIAASEREANGLKPLTEAEKLQVSLTEQLASGKLKLTAGHQREYEAEIKRLGVADAVNESRKRAAQGAADWLKIEKEWKDAAEKTIDTATKEAERNEELARTFGMTKSAVEALELARLEEQLAQRSSVGMTLYEIENLEKLIDAKKRNRDALASLEVQDANKKAADKAVADWQRSAEQIGQSLTDNLMRGGKSAAQYLKDLFRTMVLRPILQPIGNAVGGFVTDMMGMPRPAGASAGAGGITDTARAASSMYDMYKAGGTLEKYVTNGVQAAFDKLGLSQAGGAPGSAAQSIGSMAGQYMPMIATAVAAYYAGSAVANGYKVGGTGLANVINSFGIVGGLVNRAFGMKDKEYADASSLVGSIGAGGFAGTVNTAWTQEGGWFRSDKDGVDKAPVNAEMAKGLGAGYEAIKAASADFAKTLGINADFIKDRAQAVNIALGKDEAANQKAIADFFVGVGNTIAGELLPSLSQFQQEGEQASATLQRLATGYALVDTALTSIGMAFGAVGVQSLDARERLLAAAGGLEAFAANTAGFQQNFLTEAERNAPVLKSVTEQLAAMGLSSVDTRDEFKAVVLGLDLTTEAGAKQYGSLMKLQAAFAQVYPATENAAKAMQERASLQDQLDELTMSSTQLLEKQRNALDESNRALFDQVQAVRAQEAAAQQVAEFLQSSMTMAAEVERQRQASIAEAQAAATAANRSWLDSMVSGIDRAKEAAQAFRDLNESLKLGDLSPLSKEAQYGLARNQLLSASPENLSSAASTFLKAAKDRDEGSLAYARDFAMVQQLIEGAARGKDDNAAALYRSALWFRDQMLGVDGSHATGLDYVPFDGYRAELHRGERVQTAAEARGADATAAAVQRLAGIVEQHGVVLERIAKNTMISAEFDEKCDAIGMPNVRDEVTA